MLNAGHLNLAPSDEINAIAILDPGVSPKVEDPQTYKGTSLSAFDTWDDATLAIVSIEANERSFYSSIKLVPDGGELTSFEMRPNSSTGRVQVDAVAVAGSDIWLLVKVDAPEGMTPFEGGPVIDEQGTLLVQLQLNESGLELVSTTTVSDGPAFFSSTFATDGDRHFMTGTLTPGAPSTLGGVNLSAEATTNQAFQLFADSSSNEPVGFVVTGSDAEGNPVSAIATTGDFYRVGDSLQTVLAAAAAASSLEVRRITPDGLSEAAVEPDVAPLGTGATVLISSTLGQDEVTIDRFVAIEAEPGSATIPEVKAVKLTAEGIWVAVNASGVIRVADETYGEPNNANSFLFLISSDGTPKVLKKFRTESPPEARTEISGLTCNPKTGQIALSINTLVNEGTPFHYGFVNLDDGSAVNVHFTGNLGISAAMVILSPESGELNVINLLPFNLGDNHPYIVVSGVEPFGQGFKVFGSSLTNDIVAHPQQVLLPLFRSPVPEEARQLFTFCTKPADRGELFIRIERIGSSTVEVRHNGDGVRFFDMDERTWSETVRENPVTLSTKENSRGLIQAVRGE